MATQVEKDIQYFEKLAQTLLLSYAKFYSVATPPEFILEVRDEIELQLQSGELPSDSMLDRLKKIDALLLDKSHITGASKWVEGIFYRTEQPKAHWWWYLPEIKNGLMTKPDLDKIFSEYAATVA